MISASFLMLFCLACKSVPENKHTYVNKGLIYLFYLLTYHDKPAFSPNSNSELQFNTFGVHLVPLVFFTEKFLSVGLKVGGN